MKQKLLKKNMSIMKRGYSIMKNIVIDKKTEKFIKGCLLGKNEDVLSIHLNDIGESFYFDNPITAQDFLNKQSIERFGDKKLRSGYFDYIDEYGAVHRYTVDSLIRGKILSFSESVAVKLSGKELFDKFGYLVEDEHGKDEELLVDVMNCNGITVVHLDEDYLVFE